MNDVFSCKRREKPTGLSTRWICRPDPVQIAVTSCGTLTAASRCSVACVGGDNENEVAARMVSAMRRIAAYVTRDVS